MLRIDRAAVRIARGFTLVELMLVVGIIGIMSTLAISGLSQSFRLAQNYEAGWQGMRNLVATARSQALARGHQVAVVVNSNQLLAFIDTNQNCLYDATEELLATFPNISADQPALVQTQSMTLPANCSTNGAIQYLSFQSAGRPVASNGNFVSQMSFSLTDSARSRTKTCIVYVSGYIGCSG